MGGDAYTFNLGGLTFNITNMLSGLLIMLIVFFFLFGLSRHIQMKPKGGQNVMEWIIDFTNGIVRAQMSQEAASVYSYFAFILFVFLFIANQLGLFLQVGWNGHELIKSSTADPIVTLTFSCMVLTLSHYSGVMFKGLKGYLSELVAPNALMLPVNIIEECSNFLTLGLRIFGNIYAGELLLGLVGQLAFSHGWATIIVALPIEMIWQGFSVFIGAIQAYVFVTLTMVYISRKVYGD